MRHRLGGQRRRTWRRIILIRRKIKTFRTEAAFAAWMKVNHAREREIWRSQEEFWLRSADARAKCSHRGRCAGAGLTASAKAFDDESFLQRYTPRRAQSIWSQINREHVARLTAARPHEAAWPATGRCRQGRWPLGRRLCADARRDEGHDSRTISAPPSRPTRGRARLPDARTPNLFALAFRTNNMKTPTVVALVAMWRAAETITPSGSEARPRGAAASSVYPRTRSCCLRAAPSIRPAVQWAA